jgi:hypothetical protein
MGEKKVCTTILLDIQQAFGKVWHKGLLYKFKWNLSDQLYLIIKSHFSERYFQVKIVYELSAYHLIRAGSTRQHSGPLSAPNIHC